MSQAAQTELTRFIRSRWFNAALAWLFVGFLVTVAVGSIVTGSNLVWGGLAAVVAAVTVVPAVAFREPRVMLPWEVVVLASFLLVARVLIRDQTISDMTLAGRMSTYLAVAAIALIVTIELDVFTPVRMNHSFAVFFVVITTMAATDIWAVVQWLSDLYPGTRLLLNGRPEHVVEARLMWDFVAATIVGPLAGLLFEYYFRRRAGSRERLLEEVVEVAEESEAVEVAGFSDTAETDGDSHAPEGGKSS